MLLSLLLKMTFRSSHSQMFFKIDALTNFVIITGKHLCWNNVIIKKTPIQVSSYEYCKQTVYSAAKFYKLWQNNIRKILILTQNLAQALFFFLSKARFCHMALPGAYNFLFFRSHHTPYKRYRLAILLFCVLQCFHSLKNFLNWSRNQNKGKIILRWLRVKQKLFFLKFLIYKLLKVKI